MVDAILGRRIVDSASACVDAPISIANASMRVVASSAVELVNRQLPEASCVITDGKRLRISGGSASGVYMPLMFDATVVGAIILHGDPDALEPYSHAVRTISELVTFQVMVVENLPKLPQLRDRLLADLLLNDTHDDVALPSQAAALGLDLSRPRIVSLLDVRDALDAIYREDVHSEALPTIGAARRMERSREQLLRLLRQCAGTDSTDDFGFVDRRWLVILSIVNSESIDHMHRRVVQTVNRYLIEISRLTHARVVGAVGRFHGNWTQLCHSFADARVAAEKGEKLRGSGRVYTLEDLGLIGFVADVNGVSKAEMARRLLKPIADEPLLVSTLETYLSHDLSPTAAASELKVHRHTLGYRLDKIRLLTGLDPRRFEAATQLYAALLILKVGESACQLLDICP